MKLFTIYFERYGGEMDNQLVVAENEAEAKKIAKRDYDIEESDIEDAYEINEIDGYKITLTK